MMERTPKTPQTIRAAHASPPDSIPLCQGERRIRNDQEKGNTQMATRKSVW